MNIDRLNQMPDADFHAAMQRCCAARAWIEGMAQKRPFTSAEAMRHAAKSIWSELSEDDWLEAFNAHPRIGDLKSLQQKYGNTEAWASHEQSGAASAAKTTLQQLKSGNDTYHQKFGFIFIVCATGKSAQEMLNLLNARLPNDRQQELRNAAAEQSKITLLRLEKLT